MEIKEVSRKPNNKGDPIKTKEMIKEIKKEYYKPVKGKFEFLDAGNGFFEFNHRFFPDDLILTYKFFHGEICEVPMGIVKHINNTVRKIRTLNQELSKGNKFSQTVEQSRIRFTPVDMF